MFPDEYRKTIIARNGDVPETFLVDGFVAGRAARREVEEEAAQLTSFLRAADEA